jgi:putative methyltransferase (TIGR04325 family)
MMKSWIKKIPYVRQVYESHQKNTYFNEFATVGYGNFWGIFDTFEQARAAAPPTKNIGYNDPHLAKKYQQMLEEHNWENSNKIIRSCDYPMLFWLKSILTADCHRIIDFGGNVGVHYYAYSRYLNYPTNLEWTICDVPEIITVGREVAVSRSTTQLVFTSDLDSFNAKDIFIAAGSIQYVENIAATLERQSQKPRHLLINRLPLYDGERFVTLQNGGEVFYPQFVFNQSDFIDSIEQIGYEIIDFWEDKNTACYIPYHPNRSVSSYSGLYARAIDS